LKSGAKIKASDSEFFGKSLRFCVKFLIVFAVLYAILLALDFSFIENPIASFEASLLGLQSSGNAVFINDSVFYITSSCIGLFSGIVLAAIIFACKKPSLKLKVLSLLAGAIALFLLNLARLYFVLAIGKAYGFEAADLAHTISWFATSAFILIAWYLLTERTVGKSFRELI